MKISWAKWRKQPPVDSSTGSQPSAEDTLFTDPAEPKLRRARLLYLVWGGAIGLALITCNVNRVQLSTAIFGVRALTTQGPGSYRPDYGYGRGWGWGTLGGGGMGHK